MDVVDNIYIYLYLRPKQGCWLEECHVTRILENNKQLLKVVIEKY